MVPIKSSEVQERYKGPEFNSVDLEDIEGVIENLKIDESVHEVKDIHGGTSRAIEKLKDFIENKLDNSVILETIQTRITYQV